ncbi:hypothetical protein GE300_10860 [Rhodobacteraceae bacterium 2CG4]|uniref:Uncharacterized protein n=1 Tax=Halovulum marinum TaxID=2662447 RepID=A0A6L5Z211_9RHOB|nr:hypothetical protein [Halovulum marinum]MSU90110.1 hypothetical protein [Halovulum marinum]
MTDSKKLAVAYGGFACVLEGFDNPFPIMRKVVRYFQDVAEKDPEFAGYRDIADFESLHEKLTDPDGGSRLLFEPIAGGVHVRRCAAADAAGERASDHALDDARDDARDGALDGARDGALGDALDGALDGARDIDEPAARDEAGGDEADSPPGADLSDPHDTAAAQDAPAADENAAADADAEADRPVHHDAVHHDADADADAESETVADPEDHIWHGDSLVFAHDAASPAPDAEPERHAADSAAESAAESATESAGQPAVEADGSTQPDAEAERHAAETAVEPAAESRDETRDESSRASADADAAENAGETAGETVERHAADDRTGEDTAAEADRHRDEPAAAAAEARDADTGARPAAPLRLDQAPPAPDAAHRPLTALRLGPEMATAPADPGPAPAFIDTVEAPPEPRGGLFRTRPPAQAEMPPAARGKAAADTAAEPADTAGPDHSRRGLGARTLGGLLRRKAPKTGIAAAPPETAIPPAEATAQKPAQKPAHIPAAAAAPAPEREPAPEPLPDASRDAAAKPAPSRLRVVDGDAAPLDAPAAGVRPHPAAGARPAEPSAAEPAPPAPEPAAKPAPAAPARTGGGNEMRDRLHSSFADMPEPMPAALDVGPGEGDADPGSPAGFARAVGAASLPEMMAAAAGFMMMIEGRDHVSRAELMTMVQAIAGGSPLSAEAKIKAFGKLVRGGRIVRADAGRFFLSAETVQDFQERLNELV